MRTMYCKTCAICNKTFSSKNRHAVMCSRLCAGKSGKGKTGTRPTHGATIGYLRSRLYHIWSGMKSRCYNRNSHLYVRYGGAGINVCDSWRNDFKLFETWALQNGYQDCLQIDRINNDLGYSPYNCRWVTAKVNSLNRRRALRFPNNKSTADVAKTLGLSRAAVYYRVKRLGIPMDVASSTPKAIGSQTKYFDKHVKINGKWKE